ncbi:MAG: translocation/assembly module TamB domain-containing protein [Vicinamibacterales bacterium]
MLPRRPRTIAGWWLAGLSALALVAFLAAIVVHLPPARERVLRWLQATARRTIDLDLRADTLDYNLFTLSVSLDHVVLAAASSPDAPFLQADRVAADLQWSIVRGGRTLDRVELDRPRVSIAKRADGSWNLPEGRGTTSRAPGPFYVNALVVRDLQFSLANLPAVSLEATGVGIDLAQANAPSVAGSLTAAGGVQLTVGDHRTAARDVRAAVAFDGRDVTLQPLHMAWDEGTVDFSGRVRSVFGGTTLDGALDATVDLAKAMTWIPVDAAVTGTATARGTVTGPVGAPTFDLDVAAPTLTWNALEATALTSKATWSPRGLDFATNTFGLAGGTATAAGHVAAGASTPGDGPATSSLEATWTGVDVDATISGVAGPLPLVLGARATGHTEISWAGPFAPRTLSISAVNDLSPADAGARAGARAAPGAMTAGHLELVSDGAAWRLTHDHALGTGAPKTLADAAAPPDTTRVSGVLLLDTAVDAFADVRLSGDLLVASAALDRSLADLSRGGLFNLPPSASDLRGRATYAAQVGGTLAGPTFTGPLEATNVATAWLRDAAVRTTMALTRKDLSLEDIDLRAGGNAGEGRVHLAFDGAGTSPARALTGSLTLRISDFAALDDTHVRKVDPRGRLDVQVALAGTATEPSASFDITSTGFSVGGQAPMALSVSGRADRPAVRVDHFTVAQPQGGRLAGSAAYDIAAGTLAVDVDGTDVRLDPWRAPELEVVPVGATFDLGVKLSGPVDHPLGRAVLAWRTLDAWGAELGDGRLEATGDGDTVALSGSVPTLGLTLTGTVSPRSPYAFDASVGGRTALDRVVGALRTHVPETLVAAGEASFDARGRGTFTDLARAAWTVEPRDLRGSINQVPVQLATGGSIRLEAGDLAIDTMALFVGQTAVTLRGALPDAPASATDGLQLTIDGRVSDLTALASFVPAIEPLRAEGTLTAALRATGTIGRPDLEGTLAVSSGTIGWGDVPAATGVDVHASLARGVVAFDRAKATWEGATVDARGTLPLRTLALPERLSAALPPSTEPARLSAAIADVTQAALTPFVSDETLANLTGRVNASLELTADRVELAHLAGDLWIENAAVTASQVALAQPSRTRLGIANGILDIASWTLKGETTSVALSGTVGLAAPHDLHLATKGVFDLAALRALLGPVDTGGYVTADVRIDGPAAAPALQGTAYLTDGVLQVRSARLGVSDITSTILLSGSRLVLNEGFGWANGGLVSFSGELTYPSFHLEDGRFALSGSQIALEVPRGLRSEIEPSIRLTMVKGESTLEGRIIVTGGSYRDPFNLTTEVLSAIGPATQAGSESSMVNRIRLDVGVTTNQDILVDNNYGRLDVASDLRVVGTIGQPALVGRLTMREGGEIYLGGNTYHLERGTIDFTNRTHIEPSLAITAKTRIREYDVTLNLSGTPATLRTELTADPPQLSQSELVALLVTGDPQTTSLGSQLNGTQVLGLLSGELSGFISRTVGLRGLRVERGLGSTASDFDLVSSDTEPTTRLTLTRSLSHWFEVILSQDVRETGKLTWITIFRPHRLVDLRVASRDNGTRSAEIRQDFTFGAPSTPAPGASTARETSAPSPRVVSVSVSGEPGFAEASLVERLRMRVGRAFDFFDWQHDRDDLEAFYRERGYLEAKITALRHLDAPASTAATGGTAPGVALEYRIVRGPKCELAIVGGALDAKGRKELMDIWSESVFDGFLVDDLGRAARTELGHAGFLRAKVAVDVVERSADLKRIRVAIDSGSLVPVATIVYVGATSESVESLQALVEREGLSLSPWLYPDLIESRLADHYRERGHLAVRVTADPPAFDGAGSTARVRIVEGPAFSVGDVRVVGAAARGEEDVRRQFGVASGQPYSATAVEQGRRNVDTGYRQLGFNAVQNVVDVELDRTRGTADVTLRVEEGPQQRLAGVTVKGNETTRLKTVLSVLGLQPGEPVNLARWDEARRRLYDLGTFRSVDVSPVEAGGATPPSDAGQALVDADVTVQEWPRYRFRYGFQVASELDPTTDLRDTKPAALGELSRRNLFGAALDSGVTVRVQSGRQVGRAYVTTPRLFGTNLRTSLFATRSRQTLPTADTPGSVTFLEELTSVALEQRIRPTRLLEVVYSYRFERNHTFETRPEPHGIDLPAVNVGRYNAALVVDTRDNFGNPSRGVFHASNVEVASSSLGSDVSFVKYLGQQFLYPRVGRVLLASALRVGLARPFGRNDSLLRSERFFVGGSNSVRGYREDGLGPFDDLLREPAGGQALLVVNEEARFPIHRWLHGVAFIDAGNVFARVADVRLDGLKVGVGLGLRIDTPFALVRVDYGVPASDRATASRGRWYFSLGQIF